MSDIGRDVKSGVKRSVGGGAGIGVGSGGFGEVESSDYV